MCLFLTTTIANAAAQVGTAPQNSNAVEQQASPAAPIDGSLVIESTPPLAVDRSPAPSIGEPSLLLMRLLCSESAETQGGATPESPNSLYSVPRLSGTLELAKTWRSSVTALNYTGGGIFYPSDTLQTNEFSATQHFVMGRKQLILSDALSDDYGGSFGSPSSGGAGLNNLNLASPAMHGIAAHDSSVFSGGDTFGGLQQGSYLANVGQAVLMDDLTRRTSVVLAGSYAFANYNGSGAALIDSRQLSLRAGYDYKLSPRSGVGVMYGYRVFRFPHNSTQSVVDNLVRLSYQRFLSSNLSLTVGAGPEFTNLTTNVALPIITPPIVLKLKSSQVNGSVFGSLGYKWKKTALGLSYDRLTTSGSGFSAGANTDVATASAAHRVFRAWQGSFDSGYARLTQIRTSTTAALSYHYWYAGLAVERYLAGGMSLFASYQYNRQYSGGSLCTVTQGCVFGGNVVLVGFTWHARPMRLDRGGFRQSDATITSAGDQLQQQ